MALFLTNRNDFSVRSEIDAGRTDGRTDADGRTDDGRTDGRRTDDGRNKFGRKNSDEKIPTKNFYVHVDLNFTSMSTSIIRPCRPQLYVHVDLNFTSMSTWQRAKTLVSKRDLASFTYLLPISCLSFAYLPHHVPVENSVLLQNAVFF